LSRNLTNLYMQDGQTGKSRRVSGGQVWKRRQLCMGFVFLPSESDWEWWVRRNEEVAVGWWSQSQKSQHLQQWVSLYYFGFSFHYISLHHLIFYISLLIICSFLITSILIPIQ